MADFIIKYWVECLLGLISSGLVFSFKHLTTRLKKVKQDNEVIRLGMKALLRNEIISTYNHYEVKEYLPIYARESLSDLHKQYKALGGNGAIDSLIEIAFEWSTHGKEAK